MPHDVTVSIVTAEELERDLAGYGALLHACVQDGASVSFILPFSREEAEAFWLKKVLPGVRDGGLILLVARQGGRIAGSVQLDHDTPPNQPHRAEVRKLLVHPAFRRKGIARLLMAELERLARNLDRSLITLDTRTGDKAEPLYASMGYQVAGIIPDFCRDTVSERLDPTTIMYKAL
jgi:ribosomal protein S18 acetylase RimI-like enzyme